MNSMPASKAVRSVKLNAQYSLPSFKKSSKAVEDLKTSVKKSSNVKVSRKLAHQCISTNFIVTYSKCDVFEHTMQFLEDCVLYKDSVLHIVKFFSQVNKVYMPPIYILQLIVIQLLYSQIAWFYDFNWY
jgi:hypothetical protein